MAVENPESLGQLRNYRELSHVFSHRCLLMLTLLFRYKKLSKLRLAEVVGQSPQEIDEQLNKMESLGVVRMKEDGVEIRTKGRKIVAALQLYKFEPAFPDNSCVSHLSESKRKRRIGVNDFYFPKDIDVS